MLTNSPLSSNSLWKYLHRNLGKIFNLLAKRSNSLVNAKLQSAQNSKLLARLVPKNLLYQFSVKMHIILTPPNFPLTRGGTAGSGVIFMRLHMEMGLNAPYLTVLNNSLQLYCSYFDLTSNLSLILPFTYTSNNFLRLCSV